jgi:pilus assembly protein Flp/PilA
MFTTYLSLKNRVISLVKDDKGATAIEYGLIAAGIAVAIVAAVFALGDTLSAMFEGVTTNLQSR